MDPSKQPLLPPAGNPQFQQQMPPQQQPQYAPQQQPQYAQQPHQQQAQQQAQQVAPDSVAMGSREQLLDLARQHQQNDQHAQSEHCGASMAGGPPPSYYTQEQLESLPPPPPDYAAATRNEGSVDLRVFQQYQTQQQGQQRFSFSTAETEYDSNKGVKSCDPKLDSPAAIHEWFSTYNSRPRVSCNVEGYHYVTRYRTEHYTDDNGNSRSRQVSYQDRVTDFRYSIDLTQFVSEHGFLQTFDTSRTFEENCNMYISSQNKMKELEMRKTVGIDFNMLRSLIVGRIRALGFFRQLSVEFPMANYKARIYNDHWMKKCWDNPCGKCLCYLTCTWCFVKCYEEKTEACRSHFMATMDTFNIFMAISSQVDNACGKCFCYLTCTWCFVKCYEEKTEACRSHFMATMDTFNIFMAISSQVYAVVHF